ncbi:helix-turn-helix domain-containing protein [Qipengyuania marisflavi]|uniref:helix-turn-helix domain-containing protein n=1 Tax=Qipengyuania marisflavi TaxID=2486356 RepID=UPI003CCC7DCF
MTQQALADQLGVSQQTLAHYEVGRVGVGAAMLPVLSELLDLSFDELLVGEVLARTPGKRGPAMDL